MPGPAPEVLSVRPAWAVAGGRVTIAGRGFDPDPLPSVRIGGLPARIVFASSQALTVVVPDGVDGDQLPAQVGDAGGADVVLSVGRPIARGLHQVDSPAVDRDGNWYLTYSGTRNDQAPVSIFRVGRDGSREPFASGIPNPTSMAFDATGDLFVSSRFEGRVYRVSPHGKVEVVAADLGVATGIAFDADGGLYVGDRSGTILRLDGAGHARPYAELPPSVAAFHLTSGPDRCLYATAPTLAAADAVYRIDQGGTVEVLQTGFGRPQGLAFDRDGHLHVVEALAGSAGLHRVTAGEPNDLMLAAAALVGVAFDPTGDLVVASSDTAYRVSLAAR